MAASPGLTLVTDARYLVQPQRKRVRVVVDIRATNTLAGTKAGTFYFERAALAILPGATGLVVTERNAPAGAPSPSIAAIRGTAGSSLASIVSIAFGRRLVSGGSISLRLRFDLPDPGGAPTRAVRVGSAILGFPVWAFASPSTPGSTVTVEVPAGYRVSLAVGTLAASSTTTGETVLRSGPLAKPLAFYAYVRADRPAALVESTTSVVVGSTAVALTVRSFAEETVWTARTTELFVAALPRLAAATGLSFPGDRLAVEESSDRATGGYAGLFDVSTATVRVAYDARPIVALHEAAHAWFNGELLAERWANEGFASVYAARVAPELEVTAPAPRITTRLAGYRIPLNAWGGVGEASAGTEDFGYAAAELLAAAIVARAGGTEPLRAVWSAALAGEAAYQPRTAAGPAGEIESATGAEASPDWRGLLDLLEQRTGARYDDLWRRVVVRPDEATLLDDRAVSLRRYEAAIRRAGEWRLSPLVRRALDAWRFETADQLLAESVVALKTWDRVRTAAHDAGLTPPSLARQQFEGAAGPGEARIVMEREIDLLAALALVREMVDRVDDASLAGRVGLLFESPLEDLAAAQAHYEAGELDAATAAASDAYGAVAGSEDAGRARILLTLFTATVIGGTGLVVTDAYRRRRRDATLAPPEAAASTAAEE